MTTTKHTDERWRSIVLSIAQARTSRAGRSRGYVYLGGRCHQCQLARGGVVPEGGQVGITVSAGTCRDCLKSDVALVPTGDYDWPGLGRKAWFD